MTAGSSSAARVVIFDLDGTLTRPNLDFDAIRRAMGLSVEPRTPILEALAGMPPARRRAAEAILHRFEEQAALTAELQEQAVEVVAAIRERGVPVALLTRNSRRSVETVMARHALAVDWVHTREDGPVKPAPDAVLSIGRRFGAAAQEVWVVGDYLFD
ncbi:MAG: HAD family hydrolase, partial [Phycisphaerae bacterium]